MQAWKELYNKVETNKLFCYYGVVNAVVLLNNQKYNRGKRRGYFNRYIFAGRVPLDTRKTFIIDDDDDDDSNSDAHVRHNQSWRKKRWKGPPSPSLFPNGIYVSFFFTFSCVEDAFFKGVSCASWIIHRETYHSSNNRLSYLSEMADRNIPKLHLSC